MKAILYSLSLLLLCSFPAPAQTGSTGNGLPADNRQPTLAIRYIICAGNGIFPSRFAPGIANVDRTDPYLAEIRAVAFNENFVLPQGWQYCQGQILAIGPNVALFSLLGTTYGGNGMTTFGLPNLSGRVPYAPGQGPGLASYDQGELVGNEQTALTTAELPPHLHSTSNGPTGVVGIGLPFENHQPSLAVHHLITESGEIMMFGSNFEPDGWGFCDGRTLAIADHTNLFSVIGTNFGGDGVTTFNVPDLRGRAPVSFGQRPGASAYALGQQDGTEIVTLSSNQLPGHVHSLTSSNTGPAGCSAPFDNRQPTLTLNWIIESGGFAPTNQNQPFPLTGEMRLLAGTAAPGFGPEWLPADGNSYSTSLDLGIYLGTTFGSDGPGSFRVPDLRGTVGVGFGQGPGTSFYLTGQTAGQETTVITINELPAHTHTLPLIPPLITSASNTTFTVGISNAFTVTRTGDPTPGLFITGTLPNGIGFNPGTANLSGTAAAGTGGTYPLTITATNTAGTNVQSFTLTVLEAPAISCPATITTNNAPGQCAQTVAFAATVTAGFPAPVVTYTLNSNVITSPYVFPKGSNVVTVTATNSVATNATCAFTVVVNDTEPPRSCITPPTNMIAWLPGDGHLLDIQGTNLGTASAGNSYVTGKVGQAIRFNGVNQLVSVVDSPALHLTGNQVTIDGWIRPTAVTSDDIYFGKSQSGANDYLLIRQFDQLTGIIKAGGAEVIIAGTVPFVPPTNQWTHIALTYDGATARLFANGVVIGSAAKTGNLAGSSVPFFIGGRVGGLFFAGDVDEVEVFNRALSTNEIRAIYDADAFGKCKPIVVTNQPGLCSAVVNFTVPTADNCSSVTVTSAPASGATFPVGVSIVTNSATDASGNVFTNTIRVTVRDVEAPVPNVGSLAVTGQCSVTLTAPTATDNCGGTITGVTTGPTNFPSQGSNVVQWTYTDVAGNVSTQSQTVIVRDTVPPSMTCPDNIVVSNALDQCGQNVFFQFLPLDNCSGPLTNVSLPPPNSFFPVGTTTVTNISTDAAGNSNSCTFTVTVIDAQAPTINCPANRILSTDPGQSSRSNVTWLASATDNCDVSPFVVSAPASGATFPVGTNTVTVTANDSHGNTNTCTFIVVVITNHAPVLAPVTTQRIAPNERLEIELGASDPDGDSLTFSLTSAPAGATITSNIFTWTPTFAQALSSNAITVRVADNGTPSLTATQTFIVFVGDYLNLVLGKTNVESGEIARVPVTVGSSFAVRDLYFTVDLDTAEFTNATLTPLAPEIASSSATYQGTNVLVEIHAGIGQFFAATQQVATLDLATATSIPSAIVPLPISSVLASNVNFGAYSNYFTVPGRVLIVRTAPLLEAFTPTPGARRLLHYGHVGLLYELENNTEPTPPWNWLPVSIIGQTNRVVTVDLLDFNPFSLYRTREILPP